ncbi:MAG: sulfotransferase, partial [Chloroflexota bacterium]
MFDLRTKEINRRNLSFGIFRLYKGALQKFDPRHFGGDSKILFVLGIQRAGTSLMYWIFERDRQTRIYRESSELSSQDKVEHVRLNPLPEVKQQLDRHQVPLIVLKPLVESQRANELLDTFPASKALWQYRHYQDVAASNLKAFGMENGIADLRPFLMNDPHNWRSQNSAEETRAIIREHFSEDMNPYDAAALFWWARSRLYFDLRLDRSDKILPCRYEDLATNPSGTMRRIYAFLGVRYPGDQIVSDVHPQSVGKGRVSILSPAIDQLCA